MSDAPKCWKSWEPVARKRHRCCECKGWIEPGERYHKFSGIWDDPDTFKTCSDCENLRKQANANNRDNGFEPTIFGHMSEDLDEDQKRAFVAVMEKRGVAVHHSWDSYKGAES